MSDRRGYDPYAPPPASLTGVVQPPEAFEEPAPSAPAAPSDNLDSLLKAELQGLADDRGLDTSGTKAQLIARLRGES
jgi:hypothetical protein